MRVPIRKKAVKKKVTKKKVTKKKLTKPKPPTKPKLSSKNVKVWVLKNRKTGDVVGFLEEDFKREIERIATYKVGRNRYSSTINKEWENIVDNALSYFREDDIIASFQTARQILPFNAFGLRLSEEYYGGSNIQAKLPKPQEEIDKLNAKFEEDIEKYKKELEEYTKQKQAEEIKKLEKELEKLKNN